MAETATYNRKRAKKESQAKAGKGEAKPEKPSESAMEFIASIAGVFAIGLFIITFIVQAFEIPSKSMVATLLVGDHVFVDRERFAPPTKWLPVAPYHEIRRGDIVVFLSLTEPGMYIVKRIRGVPGDHLHLENGKLFVNGQAQDEPFVVRNGSYSPYRDNFPRVQPTDFDQVTPEWRLTMPSHVDKNGDLVVPPDSYFGMGDNRDISYDSRFWGFIPRENVIGRPLFIYWSFETPEDQYQRRALGERLGFIGHVVLHFFDETRWSRTLKMVR